MIVFYVIISFFIGYIVGLWLCLFFGEEDIFRRFKVWRMRRLGRNCTNCEYKMLSCTYGSERCYCPKKGEYNPCTGTIVIKDKWISSTVGTRACKWKPKDKE